MACVAIPLHPPRSPYSALQASPLHLLPQPFSHLHLERTTTHLCGRAEASSQVLEDTELQCKVCNARGWIICDFCNGQKVNVQVRSNRMYRRCPSCRASGVLLCPQCKVYKCITFPDDKDGGFEM